MTWKELAEIINTMPEKVKNRPVFLLGNAANLFREDYYTTVDKITEVGKELRPLANTVGFKKGDWVIK